MEAESHLSRMKQDQEDDGGDDDNAEDSSREDEEEEDADLGEDGQDWREQVLNGKGKRPVMDVTRAKEQGQGVEVACEHSNERKRKKASYGACEQARIRE